MFNIYYSTTFEIIYLCYMFYIFKTCTSINHPAESFMLNYLNESVPERLYKYIKHPISKTKEKESKICPMGKVLIFFLILYLIIRAYCFNKFNFFYKNITVLIIAFILSLLNLNATVYLIPYFIYELWFLFL
jgi:hypothetical protein